VVHARLACLIASTVLLAVVPGTRSAEPERRSRTYQVTHSLVVKDIPERSQKVRLWFWLPADDSFQRVLDLTVPTAPPGTRVVRDATYGTPYLYAEVERPGGVVSLATDFVVRRSAVSVSLDPAKAGRLTESHRAVFAEHLRRDCPHMKVDERIVRLANEVCGEETNIVVQCRRLYDYVASNTQHYSLGGGPRSSGFGSALYCIDQKGGGCTDQHALFVALARARGIPARILFGSRLQAKNEGKEHDPGYRCWVEYFVPGHGWVPADISAGNTLPGERDFFFSGLDERRIRFAEGRDLDLSPKQDGPRVNLLIGAYVEVDGKPHLGHHRLMTFREVQRDRSEE
jgi:transglutaminase-like putative cysteine protease